MRSDISPNLVHFTRDYLSFQKIVTERRILGAAGNIKGGYTCICFSEAPLPSLPWGLVNEHAYSPYSHFGIVFSKKAIFQWGGRPVIYQSDSDYYILPESMRWRHVRYDLSIEPAIDFTWEREWRIKAQELSIDPTFAHLVFPNRYFFDRFKQEHDQIQMARVQEYSQIYSLPIAYQYYEPFPWQPWILQP